MDMESRRRFINSMMAASLAAMGGGMVFAQNYTPMGGVQIGPDGVNGNPPPGPIGAGAPQPGGGAAGGGRGRGGGGGARVPRPKPSGIYWISGTGTEKNPAATWDIKDHAKITMDNIKRGVERMGGTMDSFLYAQVFFCLHLDDGEPMPKGSAAFAAYQKAYEDLNSVYFSSEYWPNGAPPRSCFALSWIPGSSLIEISAAAWIDPSIVPPPAPPRAPRGAAGNGAPAGPPS